MFIKGSRRVIDVKFDTIAHLTLDEPYNSVDAGNMVRNSTAVIPTLSLGCYFAMDCGSKGYPDHPEYIFFRKMLNQYVSDQIKRCTIPELRKNYFRFFDWINKKIESRKIKELNLTVFPASR